MRHLFSAMLIAASLHAQTPAIHVEDIVESVRQRYPLLLAAMADRDIAQADVLTAEGQFDLTLRSRLDTDSIGFYENRRFDSWVEQPLSFQGMSFYSGYRLGDGAFAPYDGKLATRSLGEIRSGFRLPLLRDREIDSRRGELSKAKIGRKIADLSVDQQRLVVLQTAVSRYWSWVALGRRLGITREVLQVAEARQKLLEDGVREGQLPRIEAIDNQRAILQRRSAAVEAERGFQQSSIELSLFYRNSSGSPVVPTMEQLPGRFPNSVADPPPDIEADIKTALQRRPEIGRLEALADQNEVDVRLARNGTKPAVSVVAGFVSESGDGVSVRRGPQEFKAGLSFDLPLQNRSARGKLAAVQARARQVGIRLNFLRDQTAAEVKDAASAVAAAQERLRLLGDEVGVSRELEEAERTRFDVGDGTLFMLNLREQATMDAAVREALANADYQRALASYEYATGALLNR
ncbi:MAG: TolC family protein [Bryobacteraceae bacterium]|nr:TolC family protein [Bryobacteraceae bacterium]